MDNRVTIHQKEIRIRHAGKAWRYIHDVTGANAGNLNRKALEDGSRQYTYGLMFHEWERYASVFSALGITGENHSRAGLLGSTSAEAIFTIYGLNMTGAEVSLVPAYSAIFTKKITETIRSEKLTDVIVTDDFAQGGLVHDLLEQKQALGLRHVIILHIPVTGVTVNPMLTTVQEAKCKYLKGLYGNRQICMDELLAEYGRYPIAYAPEESCDTAFILHTSGTTGGAGKPVVLSDRAFNAAASGFFEIDGLDLPQEDLATAVIVDLSNAYSIIDQVHVPFAMGASVAVVPGGVLNPWFYKAIPHYHITFLFTISAMFERWMKLPESVRQAFVDVYVRDKKIGADNIPTQFMMVEDIPLNANGKLDIFRITRERIGGEAYDLVPVFTDGKLTDIQTKHVENVNSMTAGTVPHGMENHSAYNMFDFFNAAAPSGKTAGSSLHAASGIFGVLFPDEDRSRKRSSMPEIPEIVRKAVLKYGNRMIGMISTGRKTIDFDFEDVSER